MVWVPPVPHNSHSYEACARYICSQINGTTDISCVCSPIETVSKIPALDIPLWCVPILLVVFVFGVWLMFKLAEDYDKQQSNANNKK